MSESVEYGIDLGTTNSCIARWEEGGVRVFQNNDQMNVTPSAIHVLKSGRMIVGRRACSAVLTDADNVAVEFKRLMGQKSSKRFPAAQRELSPEQLSSEVLKALKEDVRRQTGADVVSAVVTVPAAFGALQCEATARAAALAGLTEAPLLQEPIAAALGYGVRPGSANQKWLVFDLGGGTLDVAVVSTRDGRLNVLEHRGDNLLGGKDIDRAIVERILIPAIAGTHAIGREGPGSARAALLPRLRLKAEEAKIDLSRDESVVVSLFDVGTDDEGAPIEIDVSITRSELEKLVAPLAEKCSALALEALTGARLRGPDLDRILLVGGPTQMPLLRAMLEQRIGAPIDFSADPMTVVGRGAAVYASALERKPRATVTAEDVAASPDRVSLKVAYEPVSAELECVIAGRVTTTHEQVEIKLEEGGGLWSSGWVKPDSGIFEVTASLKPGDVSTFWVYARDASGRLLEADPAELKIRHGLVPSAPPLPHTLSVEVLAPEGARLDPVFARNTPLPAEKRIKYRATHALVPNKPESDLAIKLWEGEYLEDPEANDWVGKITLSHEAVPRSVPEGAEIELNLRISASRLISVDAFVPHLNKTFSDQLYVPQRDERDLGTAARAASEEADVLGRRLEHLERSARGGVGKQEVDGLKRDVDGLKAAGEQAAAGDGADPDATQRFMQQSKSVRIKLGELERKTADGRASVGSPARLQRVEQAEKATKQFGSPLEKQEMAALLRELGRASDKGDERTVQRICEDIDGLWFRVLAKHDWFWRDMLESMSGSAASSTNPAEAERLIAAGRSAIAKGDGDALRDAVKALKKLQHKDSGEQLAERALDTGLRRY